jgi:hypothetical protein
MAQALEQVLEHGTKVARTLGSTVPCYTRLIIHFMCKLLAHEISAATLAMLLWTRQATSMRVGGL